MVSSFRNRVVDRDISVSLESVNELEFVIDGFAIRREQSCEANCGSIKTR